MNLESLEQQLISTLDDGRLSHDEKYELSSVARQCNEQQKRFLRNKAFELYRNKYVITDEYSKEKALEGARWLEKTLKALDPIDDLAYYNHAYFSPGEDCRNKIVSLCDDAKDAIAICVFTISDNIITEAILRAYQRAVNVKIISDNHKSEDRGSDIYYLIEQGVDIKMDASEYHMHHKFALFDSAILLNGSFNWTRSATDKNQENIAITNTPSLVKKYQSQFDALWKKYR